MPSKSTLIKRRYVDAILKAHPTYTPDSAIAQRAAKSLIGLPEQTLFYLYHLIPQEKQIELQKEVIGDEQPPTHVSTLRP